MMSENKISEEEFDKRFLGFIKNIPSKKEAENSGIYSKLKAKSKKEIFFYVSAYNKEKLNSKEKYININDIHISLDRDDIKSRIPSLISLDGLKEIYYNNDYIPIPHKKYYDSILERILAKSYISSKDLVFNKKLFQKHLNEIFGWEFKLNKIYSKKDIIDIIKNEQPDIDTSKINLDDFTKKTDSTEKFFEKLEDEYKCIYTYDWYEFEDNENDYKSISIKNIILYGAPGVGKTHNINKLINLIEDGYDERKIFDLIRKNEESNDTLDEELGKRVKFITFHQSFGYEDFIEGFRPNEDGKIGLEDGIFKRVAKEAQKNLLNAKKESSFNLDDFLNDYVAFVEEKESYEIDVNLKIEVNKDSNGNFKSFIASGRIKNQSLTKSIIERDFEDFLSGKIESSSDIKPTFESNQKQHGNAPYYYLLFKDMKKFYELHKEKYLFEKEELKNYYLIIDEINRGNISKIFGELITLIEESKRDNLEVTLPYSKEPFRVPSNLFIIGTMNSTDKSIALIDIALRRRWTFLKMEPNEELVSDIAREYFIKLNSKIEEKLGSDFKIGHSYFMDINTQEDLDFVKSFKIKPLLEEYFYGDNESLKEVLDIIV